MQSVREKSRFVSPNVVKLILNAFLFLAFLSTDELSVSYALYFLVVCLYTYLWYPFSSVSRLAADLSATWTIGLTVFIVQRGKFPTQLEELTLFLSVGLATWGSIMSLWMMTKNFADHFRSSR